MKSDGAFDDSKIVSESRVQEMRIEFQVHAGIQRRQQVLKGCPPAELVGTSQIRESTFAQSFGFQQLRREKIAVVCI
jgi:hypothetical protein